MESLIECVHRNVIESTNGRDDRRDDFPTHWLCLNCGDRFPLIGDIDQWKPKLVARMSSERIIPT